MSFPYNCVDAYVRSTLECVRLDAAFGSFSALFQDPIVVLWSSASQGGVEPHALQGASHIRIDAVLSEAHEQPPLEPLTATTEHHGLKPYQKCRNSSAGLKPGATSRLRCWAGNGTLVV